ncbi:MAG: NlpC/P60 family protein [Balneolaceae bacterium]|nr:NlpC/P60 family protein [Balneolaceae bacterium]
MFSLSQTSKTVPFAVVCLLFFYVTGCGIANRATIPDTEPKTNTEDEPANLPLAMDVSGKSSVEDVTSVRRQLQNAHQQWEGTPYRYGGNSANGIDCSAFTQIVFRDFFNTDLPRNTRSQLQEGSGVRRRSIQTGDLIFFKTGRKSLHVGISMGNGDFLHASVSSGVMISNIGEQYWALRYLGARRVL